jgi:hypothetical protein
LMFTSANFCVSGTLLYKQQVQHGHFRFIHSITAFCDINTLEFLSYPVLGSAVRNLLICFYIVLCMQFLSFDMEYNALIIIIIECQSFWTTICQ